MSKVTAGLLRGCRRFPRTVALAVGLLLMSGFRSVLDARVASARVQVEKGALDAGRGIRDIDPGAEVGTSSSITSVVGSSSYSTNATTSTLSSSVTTGAGSGGGSPSWCWTSATKGGWWTSSTTSNSCWSWTSAKAKSSPRVEDATACDGPAAFDTCRPVSEDLRGEWRFRLGCSDASCDVRRHPAGRLGLLSGILRQTAQRSPTTQMRAGGSLRCTKEGASERSCVILDSVRVTVARGRALDASQVRR
jgi:hypothetical protein